jgi:hypothetical protein
MPYSTLPLPSGPFDTIDFADWVELLALLSGDGICGAAEFESALSVAGCDLADLAEGGAVEATYAPEEGATSPALIPPRDAEQLFQLQQQARLARKGSLTPALAQRPGHTVEAKAHQVFAELEARQIVMARTYPFEVAPGRLRVRGCWQECTAYTFCLCLSYLRTEADPPPTPLAEQAAKLFERLATVAAKNFVNGEARRFGFPREAQDEMPPGFEEAVHKLCEVLGEGQGFNVLAPGPTPKNKDGHLDVVAWRDFPDGAPGKLVLFGSCASGGNWRRKLTELNPGAFCRKWIAGLCSPILKTMFIPYRIGTGNLDWRDRVCDAGIIFERCRIAYWADQDPSAWDSAAHQEWVAKALGRLREGNVG